MSPEQAPARWADCSRVALQQLLAEGCSISWICRIWRRVQGPRGVPLRKSCPSPAPDEQASALKPIHSNLHCASICVFAKVLSACSIYRTARPPDNARHVFLSLSAGDVCRRVLSRVCARYDAETKPVGLLLRRGDLRYGLSVEAGLLGHWACRWGICGDAEHLRRLGDPVLLLLLSGPQKGRHSPTAALAVDGGLGPMYVVV